MTLAGCENAGIFHDCWIRCQICIHYSAKTASMAQFLGFVRQFRERNSDRSARALQNNGNVFEMESKCSLWNSTSTLICCHNCDKLDYKSTTPSQFCVIWFVFRLFSSLTFVLIASSTLATHPHFVRTCQSFRSTFASLAPLPRPTMARLRAVMAFPSRWFSITALVLLLGGHLTLEQANSGGGKCRQLVHAWYLLPRLC